MSAGGLSGPALDELKAGAKSPANAPTQVDRELRSVREIGGEAFSAVAHDLVEFLCKGTLAPERLARFCADAGVLSDEKALQAFADVIWSHGALANADASANASAKANAATDPKRSGGEARSMPFKRLAAFARQLVDAEKGNALPRKVLMTTLSLDLLEESRCDERIAQTLSKWLGFRGEVTHNPQPATRNPTIRMIADEKAMFNRLRRMNTAIVYRQHRYNLMHEETEGAQSAGKAPEATSNR
eukprot:scaffold344_cov235-Pinguiococcus_pyrenoidosus.AAC.4